MRLRSAVYAALAALSIAFAITVAHYYRGGLALVHPVRRAITDDERARARALGGEDVSFRATDGLTIRGTWIAPKNGVVLVMGHGLGENRMHFLFEAELLARHGYGALFFDWRNHGDSDGNVSTWGDLEQRDLEAAVAFADARGAKVATLGFSIGGSTVFLEAGHDAHVRAIVIEAIWTTMDEEMHDKMDGRGFVSHAPSVLAMKRAGVDFDHVRPIDHAAELGARPKLFITGTADTDTPVGIVERVMAVTPDPKELWVVPGATHGHYAEAAPAEYERTLIDFLDRAFAK